VLECVGLDQAVETALAIARPGGADRSGWRGRARDDADRRCILEERFDGRRPGPARAYIEELLPDVLEGRIEPGRVFDRTGSLEEVPDGYRAMNDRDVLKFQVKP
jgi:threonine dehydrogenase-like Zn-dependent dehydrogenase